MVIKCWVKSCSAEMDSKPLSFQCHLSHWQDRDFLMAAQQPCCKMCCNNCIGPWELLAAWCAAPTCLLTCSSSQPLLNSLASPRTHLLTSHCPFVLLFRSLCLTEDNGNFITDYSFITDFSRTKASKPSLKLRDFSTLEKWLANSDLPTSGLICLQRVYKIFCYL